LPLTSTNANTKVRSCELCFPLKGRSHPKFASSHSSPCPQHESKEATVPTPTATRQHRTAEEISPAWAPSANTSPSPRSARSSK
jgi:hypothetical protein